MKGAGAKRLRDSEFKQGSILEIRLQNFMCHADFRCVFGPKVNVISGENGAGKSAIAVALSVVFGVRAAATTRGSHVNNLVQEGKRFSEIQVTLCNVGRNPFKPEIAGKRVVLVRRIARSGASTYKVVGENGNVIGASKKDLDGVLLHFGIQADSPCQIMHQEEMKAFLAAHATSKDLYRFFMRSTLIEQIHEILIGCKNNLEFTKRSIEANRGTLLVGLQEKLREAEDAYKAAKKYRTLKDSIVKYKEKLIWRRVQQIRTNLERGRAESIELRQVLAQRSLEVEDLESRLVELSAERVNLLEIAQKAETEMESMRGDWNHEDEEKRKLISERRNCEREIENLARQIGISRRNIQEKQREITQIGVEGERIEKKRQEDFRRMEMLEVKLRNELREIEAKLRDSADNTRFNERLEQIKERKNEIDREISEYTKTRLDNKRKIEKLSMHAAKKEQDPLALYQTDLRKFVQLLKQYEDKFRDPPRGPIGTLVRVRDEKWAPAVETHIKGAVTAFVFTCMNDERVFSELRSRYFPQLKTRSFVQRRTVPYAESDVYLPPPISLSRHRRSAERVPLPTILSQVVCDDPVVMNLLIDQFNIERVLLTETRAEASEVLFEGKCEGNPTPFTFRTLDGYLLRRLRGVEATFDEETTNKFLLSVPRESDRRERESGRGERRQREDDDEDIQEGTGSSDEELKRKKEMAEREYRQAQLESRRREEEKAKLVAEEQQIVRRLSYAETAQTELKGKQMEVKTELENVERRRKLAEISGDDLEDGSGDGEFDESGGSGDPIERMNRKRKAGLELKAAQQKKALEREIEQETQFIAQTTEQIQQMKSVRLTEISVRLAEVEKKARERDEEKQMFAQKVEERKEKVNKVENELRSTTKRKIEAISKKKMAIDRLRGCEENVNQIEADLASKTVKAEQSSREPGPIKESEGELQAELAKYEEMKKKGGKRTVQQRGEGGRMVDVEVAVLEVEEAEVLVRKAERSLKKTGEMIERLTNIQTLLSDALRDRLVHWEQLRERLLQKFQVLFAKELSHRGMDGTVTWNIKEETLSLKFNTSSSPSAAPSPIEDDNSATSHSALHSSTSPSPSLSPSPSPSPSPSELFTHPRFRMTQHGSVASADPSSSSQVLSQSSSDSSSSRRGGARYVRSLSGGERSYSTLCFLLSLWKLSEHPFRLVDEFDVFCDEVTRKLSAELLVRYALQTQSQLLLITPLNRSAFSGNFRKKHLITDNDSNTRDNDENEEEQEADENDVNIIVIKRTDKRRPPS
ncbi:Structural maintenance of chromosomes protein 6, SMC6 [Monocercomonoides exilis]|uniref:Structural maintenance of chromosomes protein 6, SMC6 n=1 Tax=Monocercomonoides exilis TaxID=2049356 RepID=UPI0035598F7D|nr:Structural maintenance of chromosomes protein 6, SMC6 [Monocercomonoides exilis]|eukprot:MONOS_1281.1-p1 / transcript=MONOS_1281.1 / gene=MONOS_1281 / organism=Monocercomonoides_exilis_PA203 / gene_product=Structural maintenance of chromosomes protein 6, SMC6 / transcript_product=Structural maintenance of chromosomes protein 6, SMC6 / location=Mono_scaffold00022:36947-42053(-) / protein_length=1270 / sequence_SO=supercontig / SO=protein_coding / is_pseudo=false